VISYLLRWRNGSNVFVVFATSASFVYLFMVLGRLTFEEYHLYVLLCNHITYNVCKCNYFNLISCINNNQLSISN
jgi:hypothetical protein